MCGLQKYSYPFIFFHVLYCCLMLNCFKLNQINLHSVHHNVLLEGSLLPSLRFWMLWTGFSLRLSLYFGALSFSSSLTSPSVPEKQHHSMRLLPAHFTFGMILCRWWAELVSFKHDALNWGSSDQRILFLFQSEGPLGAFFANAKCVFMCLR